MTKKVQFYICILMSKKCRKCCEQLIHVRIVKELNMQL